MTGSSPPGESVEDRILLTKRCRACVTDRHEVCDGSRELIGGPGRTDCDCYCLDLLGDEEFNDLA